MTRDLESKTFVVTGANTGIGKITARELARRGAHVILACRSRAKTEPVLAEIKAETGNSNIELVELDLADLDVGAPLRRGAARAQDSDPRPDQQRRPRRPTRFDQGRLRARVRHEPPRSLPVHPSAARSDQGERSRADRQRVERSRTTRRRASTGTALHEPTKSVTGLREYEVSKLANVLFTKELARRLDGSGVTTYAVHPGVVATRRVAPRAAAVSLADEAVHDHHRARRAVEPAVRD